MLPWSYRQFKPHRINAYVRSPTLSRCERLCLGIIVDVGGFFMKEAEDDSGLRPLCRKHLLKKKFSFLCHFLCILFSWRFSSPFPSREKAKEKLS